MIRYRCPHCDALIVAHERRAGQSSVCKACVKPHSIPADKLRWLDESGEPVAAPAAPAQVVAQVPDAAAEPIPVAPASEAVALPATVPEIRVPPVASPLLESLAPTVPEVELPPPPAPAAAPVPPAPPVRAESVQTQAEIAAPAAEPAGRTESPTPRRDLRPSTAAWLFLTVLALLLVLVTLLGNWDLLVPALLLAAAQVVAGYAWIVALAYRREPARGLLCAIPPLTLYYLAQSEYAKLRPLRFALTGALLVMLGLAASPVRTQARALLKRPDPPAVQPAPPAKSMLEQLRDLRERRSDAGLVQLLEALTRADEPIPADAMDRAAIAAELKPLCQHQRTDVRVQALAAYARWDRDAARVACLAAVGSKDADERRMALRLLPRWKDADSARAVQSLIGPPGAVETNLAQAALEEIGGPAAEQAAVTLLSRATAANDTPAKLAALSILEKTGGAETAASLRAYGLAATDDAARARALAAAEAIEARTRSAAP